MDSSQNVLPIDPIKKIVDYLVPTELNTMREVMHWGYQVSNISLVNRDFYKSIAKTLSELLEKWRDIVRDQCKDPEVHMRIDSEHRIKMLSDDETSRQRLPELAIAILHNYSRFRPKYLFDIPKIMKFIPDSIHYNYGWTPLLFFAVVTPLVPVEIVKALIDNGADTKEECIHYQSESNITAIQALYYETINSRGEYREPNPNHPNNIRYREIKAIFNALK